jgi:hypothetical protein
LVAMLPSASAAKWPYKRSFTVHPLPKDRLGIQRYY